MLRELIARHHTHHPSWILMLFVSLSWLAVSASAQNRRDGVTVFTDPNYRGANETFYGDIEDLRPFGLNDMISSIDIPDGEAWEVCQDINYATRCEVFSRSVPDFGRLGWGDRISSLRQVQGGFRRNRSVGSSSPRGTSGSYGVTVFAEPNYRGASETFSTDVADLRTYGLNDVISSIDISPGESWEVCQDINYGARCEILTRSVSDLSALGWGERISSLRRLSGAYRDDGSSGVLSPRGTSGTAPRLVLYAQPGYRGAARVMRDEVRNLGAFGNRVRSVEVLDGAWEICDRIGWSGNCVRVEQSVPDLSRVGLYGGVVSARPDFDDYQYDNDENDRDFGR
jgi:Beta/Gamma crystallin